MIFWTVVLIGGVFRGMGWVEDVDEILQIMGMILQFRQGVGEGQNGN